MGGGKGGSSTNVTERPLSAEELRLLRTQEEALKAGMGIASDQNNLSKQNQSDWDSAYRSLETGAMSPFASRANGFNSDANILSVDGYANAKTAYDAQASGYNNTLSSLQQKLASMSPTIQTQSANRPMSPKGITGSVFQKIARSPNGTYTTTSANPEYTALQKQISGIAGQLNSAKTSFGQKQQYIADPNANLREALLQSNEQMGTVDQNSYARNKANLFNGLDSNYNKSLDDMDAAMARRGLSNSGASISAMKDIYSNRANAMSQANNQAYNQGVSAGDAYRQQKVANLTGYSQLGRGMAGMAQNYLTGAAGTYGNAAQTSGSTANGIGGNNTSFMGSQMSANAKDSETKGATTGALVGAGMKAYSDIRLKENLERIGVTDHFILYRWDWNNEARRIGVDHYPTWGVIAQDVQETMPDAVTIQPNGYLIVDYSKVFGGSK